jgi:Universal stress protein family
VAGRLAADLDAKVTAVYVRELPVVVATPYAAGLDLDRYWRGLELSVSRRTAEVLDGLGVACRLEVLVGDPAVELERAAGEHGADLIVSARAATRWPTGCCSDRSPPGWSITPADRSWSCVDHLAGLGVSGRPGRDGRPGG